MEHDIPFGNSNQENGTTFLDFPFFLGIFQWDEPTKRVPFAAEPEIPEILTKWKAPIFSFPNLLSLLLSVYRLSFLPNLYFWAMPIYPVRRPVGTCWL